MTKYIFWGLLFISLNINVPIGYGTLGLLPGFAGYYLLWKAMDRYGAYDGNGKRAAFMAQKLMVFSAVVYVLDLVSVTGRFLIAGTILAMLTDMGVCCMQYLTILTIAGQKSEKSENPEEKPEADTCMEKLKKAWFLAVCGTVVKYVLLWIPFVNLIGIWFATVAEVLFVLAACRLWKRAGGQTDAGQMG